MTVTPDLERIARRDRLFPNLSAKGFYLYLSQTVHISAYDSGRIEALLRDRNVLESHAFFSLAGHELTHWMDHTSTLWGQRNLVQVYNAMQAWMSQDADEFWRVAEFDTVSRRGSMSDYYTLVPDDPPDFGPNRPWKVRFTCGLEFGGDGRLRPDRPFVMVRFGDEQDRTVCRVPFTVTALTEACAMWSEMLTGAVLLGNSADDVAIVERARVQRELMGMLYNPYLAEYSVATHVLANAQDRTDGFTAFKLTAALARLSLNLPSSTFDAIHVPRTIAEEWGDRVENLRRTRDPGFAFFVLAQVAPKYENGTRVEDWLDETCLAAGLPKHDDLYAAADTEMSKMAADLLFGPLYPKARVLLDMGRRNFLDRGAVEHSPLVLAVATGESRCLLPPLVVSDDVAVTLAARKLPADLTDAQTAIDLAASYSGWERDFLRACSP